MTYGTILVERHDRVGLIRLNRAEAYNALSGTVMQEVIEALRAFDSEAEVGAIVITGNEKVFSAGADIKDMAGATAEQMAEQDTISLWDCVQPIKKPVIAAVSGWCLGGGNELAMACDMIVASESAKFGQPEINIGVIPGAGGTQRLTRAVGKAIAMEVIINNRNLTAQEALQYGLVNRIVPVEGYLEEALKLANEIAGRAPLAVSMAKEMIKKVFETPLAEGIAAERTGFYSLFDTEDQKEGMKAFVEKRAPHWKGR